MRSGQVDTAVEHRGPGVRPGLRALLGLDGRSGLLWLVVLELTIALLMLRNIQADGEAAMLVLSYALMAGAAVAVVRTRADPLPAPHTGAVVLVGLVATYLAARGTNGPAARDHMIWTPLAYEFVLGMLVVRGRALAAWLGVAAIVAALMLGRSSLALDSDTLACAVAAIGLVAALSVFAVIMRPTQESLQALRIEQTATAAAEATITAQDAERQRQLAKLDQVARPMLERIADGLPLSGSERLECGLLEAELRDGLRAPQLAADPVAAAARGARSRGVDVALLDDGGLAASPALVRAVLLTLAAQELDAANEGTVTIRVLPPGRRALGTIVVAAPGQDRRIEVDPHGRITGAGV